MVHIIRYLHTYVLQNNAKYVCRKLARSKSYCEISHKHFSNVLKPLQDKLMINDSWRCNLLLNG